VQRKQRDFAVLASRARRGRQSVRVFGHQGCHRHSGQAFAAALGDRGIRVNAVAPGVVPTEMSNFAKTREGLDFTLGMQALKRLATPEDIAAAIAFLASDQSQCITGETLRVDGGSKL
jgi:NAD(P)-dependent dehydrogenase (short-subunit alcohol dehydrogenase family)